MKKNIVRIVGFLLILSIVILKLNDVVAFKYTDGVTQMEYFYELPKDTVDVLVLGSSHAFVDVNPEILYDEYGLAAYDLCGSMQPMWNTYYYMKEALKYQTPKLIVLDVYRLVEAFPYSKESKIVKNTYGMRFSHNKYESIKASLSEEDKGDLLLHMVEFPSYHSRYVDLTAEDFDRSLVVDESYKGAHPVTEVAPMERPELAHVTETIEIEPKTMEYFEKILSLANEKDIPVFLINAPYIMTEDDKKVFNTLEEYLAAQTKYDNVFYVDFNRMYDEMQIDFAADFADPNHLNVNGLGKFNHALGACIKENYELPDRRGDAAFVSYE
ncbi:MAG: hypothetical protein E7289_07195 [Lachnospiraceae bacterium]|nr:hypothetical protein [Lachnospiraceae bacterium]